MRVGRPADRGSVEAPEISWRPLGQLFVEKGLLQNESLEHALAMQVETGGQLGEKLVELGYVSSTSLARLLAEQYGVELSLDTGFGTGLRAELERRHDGKGANPSPAEEPKTLTLVESDLDTGPLAGLEEQWAKLAAAEARVAELETELEAMRRLVQDRDAQIAELAVPPKKRRT